MTKPPLSDSTIGQSQPGAAEQILADFESAWKQGSVPHIEDYLRDTPPEIGAELFEGLLRLDLTMRLQKGMAPPIKDYLTRFPDRAAAVNALYAQLVNQVSTREHSEEWFFLRNGMPVGPFQFLQLKKLAQGGDLRPNDKVSRKGSVGWTEASTVPELFSGPRASGELRQPKVGQWVRDDYVLLELVGRGGMGEIYKAYRFSLQKEVALKIIRYDRFHQLSSGFQRQVLEGFQKEMQATAKLRHEQIINIHDTGDLNGLPFYTMDFGESSLAQQLHRGPLTGDKAAEYLEKVSRAVDFAHHHGIVHRDIKPHNVVLVGGKPVLADLGLAAIQDKLIEGKSKGEVVGSAPYMSPEQVRAKRVDHRCDIYGLGATLYHLITGQPPHQAADRDQVFAQILNAEPVAPRKLNPAIDRDLEAITLKCLEKDPAKRYQSAGELADDLQRFREGKPVLAKRPTITQRVWKWAKREKLQAALAASVVFLLSIVFLLLSVFFIISAVSNSQLSAALQEAELERDKAKKNADIAEAQAQEAERRRKETAQERKRANDLANILGRRVLAKFKVFDSPDPKQSIEELKKNVQTAEELLKKDPSDDNLKLQLADTFSSLSALYLQTDSPGQAAIAMQRCIDFQDQLRAKYPELIVEVALNYLELAGISGRTGKKLEEIDFDEKALKILEEVRAKGFDNPPILAAVAEAHLMLGNDYTNIKLDAARGLDHKKSAATVLEQLRAKGGVTFVPYQDQLGKAYEAIGVSLIQAQPTDALTYFDKAQKTFASRNPFSRHMAQVHHARARAHLVLKNSDHALTAVAEAYKIIAQIVDDAVPLKSSQVDPLRRLKAEILATQGWCYHQKGNSDEARAVFNKSLAERKQITRTVKNVPSIVPGYVDFAEFYQKEDDVKNAVKSWDQAIDLQEQYVQDAPADFTRHRTAGVYHYNKAIFLAKHKYFEDALLAFQEAKKHEVQAIRLSKVATYGEYLYMTFQRLFEVQMVLKKYPEAVRTITDERLKIAIWEKDRDKHFDAVKDLAQVYRDEPRQLAPIRGFVEQALSRGLLDIARMRATPALDVLLAEAQIRDVLQKYDK